MPIPNNQQLNIEIVAKGVAGAQGDNQINITNVFHYRRATTILPINLANVEAAFQAAVMVPMTNLLNVRYTQVSNSVRMMNDPTAGPLIVARALPGAIAGDSMPSLNYAYVYLGTGNRGKSFRGNKKIGPLSESDTTLGSTDILNAGALARFATLIAALVGTFTDASPQIWIPCIFSRTIQQHVAFPQVVTTDVTNGKVNKRVSHMKKRQAISLY